LAVLGGSGDEATTTQVIVWTDLDPGHTQLLKFLHLLMGHFIQLGLINKHHNE
jgi:hypothetical protein